MADADCAAAKKREAARGKREAASGERDEVKTRDPCGQQESLVDQSKDWAIRPQPQRGEKVHDHHLGPTHRAVWSVRDQPTRRRARERSPHPIVTRLSSCHRSGVPNRAARQREPNLSSFRPGGFDIPLFTGARLHGVPTDRDRSTTAADERWPGNKAACLSYLSRAQPRIATYEATHGLPFPGNPPDRSPTVDSPCPSSPPVTLADTRRSVWVWLINWARL